MYTVKGGGHLALVDSPAQVAPVIADFLGARVAGETLAGPVVAPVGTGESAAA